MMNKYLYLGLIKHTVYILKGGLNIRPWKDLELFFSDLGYEQAV